MAKGKIQGIAIEFSADASGVTKALKDADKAAKASEKSLKEINKALKFDHGNVTLLKQKQVELKKSIDATTKELEIFKQEQAAMDAAGEDKTSEAYMKLEREILYCEDRLKSFNKELLNVNGALSGIGQLGSKLDDIGNKCTEIGNKFKAVSAAAAAVVAGIGAVAYKSGVAADDLNTLSKVTGIGTDKLQLYAQASDLVDVSTETIAKSVTRLKKNMLTASQGTGDAAKAFDTLGVSVTDSNGNLRDQDAVFQDTLAALGKMTNETERDALAMQIFGKSATELNPLIEDCGQTYSDLMDTFAENDIDIVDQDTLDKANEFNDSIDKIKATWSQAVMVIGTKLAGYLAPVMEKVQIALSSIAGWVANLNPKILAIVGAIASVVAGIAPALLIFGKLSTSLGGVLTKIAPVITKFGGLKGAISALTANPIVMVAAAFAVLYASSEEFREAINGLVKTIISSFEPVFEALGPLIQSVAKVIAALAKALGPVLVPIVNSISKKIKALQPVFRALAAAIQWVANKIVGPMEKAAKKVQKAIQKIQNVVSKCKLQLPSIKLPHFTVKGGKAPYGIGGKGSLPKFSVEWYAKGGIFNSPSIIGVGEAGPEAVIPIDKLKLMLNNQAETMSSNIIEAMAMLMNMNQVSGGFGEQTIVVNLGGVKVAEQIYKLNKQGQMALQG